MPVNNLSPGWYVDAAGKKMYWTGHQWMAARPSLSEDRSNASPVVSTPPSPSVFLEQATAPVPDAAPSPHASAAAAVLTGRAETDPAFMAAISAQELVESSGRKSKPWSFAARSALAMLASAAAVAGWLLSTAIGPLW